MYNTQSRRAVKSEQEEKETNEKCRKSFVHRAGDQ